MSNMSDTSLRARRHQIVIFVIKNLLDYIFNTTGTKIVIPETSLDTQEFSSIWVPTQDVIYS
jgi:hypothetical protein